MLGICGIASGGLILSEHLLQLAASEWTHPPSRRGEFSLRTRRGLVPPWGARSVLA